MMRELLVLTIVLALGPHCSTCANGATVYSNDFSISAGGEWTSNTISTSNGEQFLATSSHGSNAGANTLSLAGLPSHTSATVSFDLYIIESWDGNGPGGGGPDNWQLLADGANLLYTNFANYDGGINTQSFPSEIPPFGSGALNPPRTGRFDAGHLGYGGDNFGDSTYRFSFTFPHGASSLALDFISFQNQGAGDEGWGIDNVNVVVEGVPEPSALILSLLLVVGLVTTTRKHERCRNA